MTQWTITVDRFAEPNHAPGTNYNAVGIVGPRAATLTAEQIINHPSAVPFEMYTDDRELVYEGFLVGDDVLAPLDQFGMPNFGCTQINVKKDGQWIRV